MERGSQVDALYMDFSKAFDTICHRNLIHKLETYGVDMKTVAWVKSYLHNRTQRVNVDGCLSDTIIVSSGIPQGSHLGPVLFAIYLEKIWKTCSGNYEM